MNSKMKITNVEAFWLRCPIPKEKQHFSDYGLLTDFDMTLVVITTESGLQGFGEAKAAVGSSGVCASIVSCIENEIKPILLGLDARNITKIWEQIYNGTRDHYALSRGRKFPILGRRGLTISALSGIDTALWDLKGKALGVPVVELLGGACRDKMEAYASGGWAKADAIGEQLNSYIAKGFKGVKMRVGIMDETVAESVKRVKAARGTIGENIKLMTDAHGTFSVPEAKQFCRAVEDCNLYWFEEPISPDNRHGTAEVKAHTCIPIAAGESEYTAFDVRDLIEVRALDVVQPDSAIIGGITEAMRVAHLAHTYQLELAPHCWGSAFSFMAGVSVAFAAPSAVVIEFSSGGNPMMYDLVNEKIETFEGNILAPTRPGLGLTPNWDFVKEFKQRI
jgi:D-galactarolactone cycloisomerase